MIKLLFITNGISGAGGLERVLSVKASYLAEKLDYEVHILTLNEEGKNPFYEFSSKIILHTIPVSGRAIRYVKQYVIGIKSIIKTLQPDVISVCDDGLKGFFLPLLTGKPCPMIYERHMPKLTAMNDNNSRGLRRFIVQTKFRLMDLFAKTYSSFVVLTDGNKEEWKLNNLKVISNPTSFYPVKTSSLDNKKVIAVGKQSFQKGYDRLLKAWQLVNKEHPDWKLEIYGKFEPAQNLKVQAESLKIQDSVFFYPPEKDIVNKYLESSVYVMSSRFEGFGMVLIEAMACGVPCVSFDCPHGPADIISHGEDGFLVKNGDVEVMAQKIIYLIENDQIRKEMGATARENVKRYMVEDVVTKWDVLFKELTNKTINKKRQC